MKVLRKGATRDGMMRAVKMADGTFQLQFKGFRGRRWTVVMAKPTYKPIERTMNRYHLT